MSKIMKMYKVAQTEKDSERSWYAVAEIHKFNDVNFTTLCADKGQAIQEFIEMKDALSGDNPDGVEQVALYTLQLDSKQIYQWAERGWIVAGIGDSYAVTDKDSLFSELQMNGQLTIPELNKIPNKAAKDQAEATFGPSLRKPQALPKPVVPDFMPDDFDSLSPGPQEQGLSAFDPSKIKGWSAEEDARKPADDEEDQADWWKK